MTLKKLSYTIYIVMKERSLIFLHLQNHVMGIIIDGNILNGGYLLLHMQ